LEHLVDESHVTPTPEAIELVIDDFFIAGSQLRKCPDDIFFVVHVFDFAK
jgi:hypothetical protein